MLSDPFDLQQRISLQEVVAGPVRRLLSSGFTHPIPLSRGADRGFFLRRNMTIAFAKFEQTVFRRINAVVEPAVRLGFGSPTFTPASLIVLETVGFKSGLPRRTPLWSLHLGRYRIISTGRGQRSFWVKNLLQQPAVSYYLGGRRRDAQAIVIADDSPAPRLAGLTPALRRLVNVLTRYAPEGWAFAILVPVTR